MSENRVKQIKSNDPCVFVGVVTRWNARTVRKSFATFRELIAWRDAQTTRHPRLRHVRTERG